MFSLFLFAGEHNLKLNMHAGRYYIETTDGALGEWDSTHFLYTTMSPVLHNKLMRLGAERIHSRYTKGIPGYHSLLRIADIARLSEVR